MSDAPPPKTLWRILVLLAPLAAVAGMFLTWRYSSASNVHFAISRNDVVRTAREQAAAKGLKADTWRVHVDIKANNELRHYLDRDASPADRAAILRVFSPVLYRCALENPSRPLDSVHVSLSPQGRLFAYAVPPTAFAREAANVPESAARAAAEQELRARLGSEFAAFHFTGTSTERHEPTASEVRRFTYRRAFNAIAEGEAAVEMSGLRAIGFSIVPRLAPGYAKQHAELGAPMQMARAILIGLVVILAVIYVLIRFAKRTREQEIPFKRALIVAAFVFIAFATAMIGGIQSGRIDALTKNQSNAPLADIVIMLITSTIMAALFGMTWGACEADVREAYPEKLTSTDALLGGMFSARALRSSLATSLTAAAWMILLTGLFSMVRHTTGAWAAIGDGELLPYQFRLPIVALMLYPFNGVPLLMGMLMAAVSITHRKGRTRNARLALIAVISLLFFVGTIGTNAPMVWSLAFAAISSASVLVPFLAGDVLAVIITTALSGWAGVAAPMLAQPNATYRTSGWAALFVMAAFVAAAMFAAMRRREETAEVARPEYARNMAERLLLVTEMDAARQAQLRVMPRIVPDIAGTRLAARHAESAEIGSDYYEFFPADGHVSVAVADAHMPGLSSALCVSMLKGLLLNYAARLTSPRDVADRVYRQLAAIFGDDLPVSFFFGRLDRTSGAFTFATFGDAPHALLVSDRAQSLEGEEFAQLRGNDAIVIYTARLAHVHDRDGATLGDDTIARELEAQSNHPQQLADALFELAARQTRGVETPQSWTAVALALDTEVRA